MKYSTLFFIVFLLFNVLLAQSQNVKELDSLGSALKHSKKTSEKVDALIGLSKAYREIDSLKSIEYLNKALVISKKENYTLGLAKYYYETGFNSFKKSNYNDALTCGKKAQILFLKASDTINFLESVNMEIGVNINSGNFDIAKKRIYKALKWLNNNPKFTKYTGGYYYYLASISGTENNLQKAIIYIKKSLNYARIKDDELLIVLDYYEISNFYYRLKDYKNAYIYISKALDKFNVSKTKKKSFTGYLNCKMGELCSELKYYKKALKHFEIALNFAKTNQDKRLTSICLDDMANLKFDTKQYNESIALSQEAMSYNPNNDFENLNSICLIADSYYKLNNYLKAKENYNRALNVFNNENYSEDKTFDRKQINKTLAKIEFALGNYKTAYQNQEKFIKLDSTSRKNSDDEKLRELQAKFELGEKDLVIKQQIIKDQKNKLDISESKSNLLKMSFFASILLGIVLFIGFSYLSNKKKYKLIESKNVIIEQKNNLLEKSKIEIAKSLQEKELLLKEIHHRIKNNLQLVMSLLRIQAQEGSYKDIDDFVVKGQSKISSISLIHQSLYQSDDFKEIVLQEYIENLVNAVKGLFENPKTEISFIINANKSTLDIQNAMPLGLIINELISNAIKHAFKDRSSGNIKIEILQEAHNFELYFSDDGIGMVKKEGETLGLELVELLVKQLHGSIVDINTSNGTKFHIKFNDTINKKFKDNSNLILKEI